MKQQVHMSKVRSAAVTHIRRKRLAFCPICMQLVDLTTFNAAAEFLGTNVTAVDALGEQGKLHRLFNNKAVLMICRVSLDECIENRRTRRFDESSEIRSRGERTNS